MTKRILYFLFFSILFPACSNQESDSWKEFQDDKYGLSFEFPSDWEITPGTVRSIAHFKETEKHGIGFISIHTNVDLAREKQKFETISEAGEAYSEHILDNEVFSDVKIFSKNDTTFLDREAISIIASGTAFNSVMKWKIILFHFKGHYYELSGTTAEERFEEMLPVIDRVMSSLKFE